MAVDRLSGTFAALADPTRRAILARLAGGEATVNQLAEPFPVSLQAISKDLKVLERAGLISRGRTAQWRPARLQGRPLEEAAGWLLRHGSSGKAASTASTSTCESSRKDRPVPEPSGTPATTRREFTITRVFDAPRRLVWTAWTEPEHIAPWWAPHGLTTPLSTVSMDVRPGGRFRATMIADADGTRYPVDLVYREVVAPERLVLAWGDPEHPAEETTRLAGSRWTSGASPPTSTPPPGSARWPRRLSPTAEISPERRLGADHADAVEPARRDQIEGNRACLAEGACWWNGFESCLACGTSSGHTCTGWSCRRSARPVSPSRPDGAPAARSASPCATSPAPTGTGWGWSHPTSRGGWCGCRLGSMRPRCSGVPYHPGAGGDAASHGPTGRRRRRAVAPAATAARPAPAPAGLPRRSTWRPPRSRAGNATP
jgi:uncharacterized protein YndB with AHSA1/START domain/DNA-binding transcriptional ArsR family regulator